jgi:hypothetical protein
MLMFGLLPTSGHDTHVDEADGSIHSALHTSSVEVKTGTRENVDSKLYIEDLKMRFQPDHVPIFDVVDANLSSKRELANSDNEARYGGYLSSECFSLSSVGAKGGDSMSIKAPQPCKQDADNIITAMDCIPQNNSFKSLNGYVDLNDGEDSFLSELLAVAFNNEVFSGTLSNEKDALVPLPDVPMPDIKGSSVGFGNFKEQKATSSTDTGYNEQPSGDVVEDGGILLSSKADILPDLNLNHFASMASTHSSHSVSMESLEDSIADARSNKVLHLN